MEKGAVAGTCIAGLLSREGGAVGNQAGSLGPLVSLIPGVAPAPGGIWGMQPEGLGPKHQERGKGSQ